MRKTLIAVPVLLGLAAAFATFAAARQASSTQRVTITHDGDSFVLTPTSSGAIKPDRGNLTFCCWTTRHVVLAGERLEVDDPHLTLTGAHGTLKLHNQIEWVDVPGGLGIFTGTWKVVGGSGAYAGLSGHGRVAGVQTAGGLNRARFFGFLTSK